jgi:hypothetical protein
MADNKRFTDGNVAWEESCDNIILVDPNKIYDKNGQFQERLVPHENLVINFQEIVKNCNSTY